MAYKDEKIVTIIMEQMAEVEERCPGYREEVQLALAEILQAERQHQFARTNIVSKSPIQKFLKRSNILRFAG